MEAAQNLVKEKEIADSVNAKESARKSLETISKENGLEYKKIGLMKI